MGWSLGNRPLDTVVFLKDNIINKIEAVLTEKKIEQSDAGIKNNPDFLQEAEVENADAYLTTYASKIN